MKKVKFVWTFDIYKSTDDGRESDYLEVKLNGGINKIIDLSHDKADYHISGLLIEIMYYERVIGNKTEIDPLGLQLVNRALSISKEYCNQKESLKNEKL